ncbi:hypothetical protein ACJMKR_03475 [Candidiatus Paracoxiella cheracis]
MTARKDFLQSLTLGKKSEPTAEYAPSLRSPWRASIVFLSLLNQEKYRHDRILNYLKLMYSAGNE